MIATSYCHFSLSTYPLSITHELRTRCFQPSATHQLCRFYRIRCAGWHALLVAPDLEGMVIGSSAKRCHSQGVCLSATVHALFALTRVGCIRGVVALYDRLWIYYGAFAACGEIHAAASRHSPKRAYSGISSLARALARLFVPAYQHWP